MDIYCAGGDPVRKSQVRRANLPTHCIEPLEGRILFSQPPLAAQPVSAYLVSAPNVTAAGGGLVDVNVQFDSGLPLDPSTFTTDNLSITGPAGSFSNYGATLNSLTTGAANVDYMFDVPGGSWNASDDGTYTISTASVSGGGPVVASLDGTPMPEIVLGTFDVSIGQSPSGFAGGSVAGNFSTQAIVAENAGALVAVGSQPISGEAGNTQLVVQRYVDGVPDDNFGGGDGRVALQIGSSSVGYGVVEQGNGKLDVAGTAADPNTNHTDFAVFGLTSGGLPDSSFGQDLDGGGAGDGVETVDFGATNSAAYADAVASDGGIIAVGTTSTTGNGAFALARVDPVTGQLDPSFGAGGIATTHFANAASAGAVIVEPDGDILVAGETSNHVVVARYTPNGALDTTFGNAGIATVAGLTTSDWDIALALQPDGKILIGANGSSDASVGVARLNGDGSVDAAFGVGGVAGVAAPAGGTASNPSLLVQPGGQVDLGETLYAAGNYSARIATFNNQGQPEGNFTGNSTTAVGAPIAASSQSERSALALSTGGVIFAFSVGSGADQTAAGNTQFTALTTDAIPPTATLAAPSVATAIASATFTVTYSDNVAVDPSTINASNITVSDGAESLAVTGVSIDSNSPGSPRTVTYTVVAPHGQFSPADDGSYTVAIAGGVKDTAGNAMVASDLGALSINLPRPRVLLGSFGIVAGRKRPVKLRTTIDGVATVVSAIHGSGVAYLDGSEVDLDITAATGRHVSVTVAPKAGITLGEVTVSGNLGTFSARTSDLVGEMTVAGGARRIALGQVSGATIEADDTIGRFRALSLTNAALLDATADTNGVVTGNGIIGNVKIINGIAGSTIAAGSMIRSIVAGSATGATVFKSADFGSASLPQKIKSISADPRFDIVAK